MAVFSPSGTSVTKLLTLAVCVAVFSKGKSVHKNVDLGSFNGTVVKLQTLVVDVANFKSIIILSILSYGRF